MFKVVAQEHPDMKLKQLGIELPAVANSNIYLNLVRQGNLIYLSGKGPLLPDGTYITGKAGGDLSPERAREAARYCAIWQLKILQKELGSLEKIRRIVKVSGYVNSGPDFYGQSKVIDGCSELLIEILGESGRHARTAVGVASLPLNWAVEVELIVELEP
ncbi:Endoribonuclease L-PSP [Flavobacterium beibuense]|uniref:Endoribonuclease L-PSP n=2 Tax=Flavobacterium beibuense TaxID=657326 RepID=A0A444WEJ6_9FLAO|nr:Endoribonuclease L-PSP [Flavobacterium beibuense]